MNILGTGLSGLVGSRIVELLSKGYTFQNLSLETGVDITDAASVESYISASDASWIFHFAAYTDVQTAEKDRSLGTRSTAWKVNVVATEHIVRTCKKYDKHLLYLDTDYAFDGTRQSYTEDDKPNPLGWYARTKYEGALRVSDMGATGLILRISNPYRAFPVGKKDFVHKMLERLKNGEAISAPDDQLFAPTFIDDLAYIIPRLLDASAYGVYHAVCDNALSPFAAAGIIASEFGISQARIEKTPFEKMFSGRAPVPQFAALKNTRLHAMGIYPRKFASGISEVRQQENLPKNP